MFMMRNINDNSSQLNRLKTHAMLEFQKTKKFICNHDSLIVSVFELDRWDFADIMFQVKLNFFIFISFQK